MPTKLKNNARSSFAKLAHTISDLSAALTLLIKRPLKDLRGVVRHKQQRIEKKYKRKSSALLGLPLAIVLALLSVLAKVLLAPLELWAAIFQKKKFPRALLFVMIPGCCLLVGWVGYSLINLRSQQAIGSLRSQASLAVDQEKFAEAVGYFEQLDAANAPLSQEENFRWAQSLAMSNHRQQANELLLELAPGPGGGIRLRSRSSACRRIARADSAAALSGRSQATVKMAFRRWW